MIPVKPKNSQLLSSIGGILAKVPPFFLLYLVPFLLSSVSAFGRNNPMVGMTVSVAVAVEESLKK